MCPFGLSQLKSNVIKYISKSHRAKNYTEKEKFMPITSKTFVPEPFRTTTVIQSQSAVKNAISALLI
jgi:hypothetical protein